MVADKTTNCLSFRVVLITALTASLFKWSNNLSPSSKTMVLTVCAVIFLCCIKSKIRPAEPTTICGFCFNFSSCLVILALPIIKALFTGISDISDNNSTCLCTCAANSCVGVKIMICVFFNSKSIFWNNGNK